MDKIVEKKNLASRLNPLSPCRKYGVSIWQCPQFLFLLIGIVIIFAIIVAYFVATLKIRDPFIVSLVVLAVGAVLLIINFIITNSFQRMAEASRMKTEFIDIVSHQLRAPLTNINFSLDFLMSDKQNRPNAKQKEFLEIVIENSKRMGGLVDNLLAVSRMESGRFPMKKKNVSLDKMTSKLIKEFGSLAQASNVEVSFDSEPNLPLVFADPLWLEQVVENLLDNAIRYTKGGGKIKIVIKSKGEKVHFQITDSGVGIPKHEQKNIFIKFFRSANALKKQTHGSGLGLHISRKIVEILGGKIWFKSKEGHGTTFYFFLPVTKINKGPQSTPIKKKKL